MLILGRGVLPDLEEGRFWLEQASRTGSAVAQAELGAIYAQGRGVELDEVSAHAWYSLAAANGEASVASELEALQQALSPEELSRAQALALELRARYPELDGAGEQVPEPAP